MREPKNIDKYCSVELAAKGLEDCAADLRKNQRDGDLVRWDLNIRFWNPDWKKGNQFVAAAEVESTPPVEKGAE